MKKIFIFMMTVMMTVMSANAQDVNNYVGSSKFTDNWDVTLQGGVVTPFNDFFKNGSTTPVVTLGVTKFVNPWLGVGVEGRTAIGTGDNYNPHTAFDAVNVSGVVKFNVLNAINFKGTRRVVEPMPYVSLGWGHTTCSDYANVSLADYHTSATRNYMTFRTGCEVNFNIGKDATNRAWAVVVNPSVVWGGVCNGVLAKDHGNFEVTAGVRYYFKNSNKKRVQSVSPVPVLLQENAALKAQIEDLQNAAKTATVAPAPVTNTVVEKVVAYVADSYTVAFANNSADLTDDAKAVLDAVSTDVNVVVDGYADAIGSARRNAVLATERANVVAEYLRARGVTVESAEGHSNNGKYCARIAVVSAKK